VFELKKKLDELFSSEIVATHQAWLPYITIPASGSAAEKARRSINTDIAYETKVDAVASTFKQLNRA